VRGLVLCVALAATPAIDLTLLDEGSAAQLTALGNEALVQGRLEAAADYFERALAVDRSAFAALFNLGLTRQQLGQDEEARRVYDDALRLRPGHAEVLCNLGVIAYRASDWATAADRFLEAARLSGTGAAADTADYWFNAGTARERLGQWVGAQRAYDEALVLDADHAGARFNLGTLYLGPLADQAGASAKALAHLGRATTADPSLSPAWLNLALAQERTGADPTAAYASALTVATGEARLTALWQRARFANRVSPPRRTAMRDDLQAILADQADFPGANGMLGLYFAAIGEYGSAIVHLEAEVADGRFDAGDDGDLEARYALALIYTDHRRDPAKALAHAAAYYQHRPDAQKIHDLRRRAMRLEATDVVATTAAVPAATKAPATSTPHQQPHDDGHAPHGAAHGHHAP
jgi:Tfp pilus assembly protein PilF